MSGKNRYAARGHGAGAAGVAVVALAIAGAAASAPGADADGRRSAAPLAAAQVVKLELRPWGLGALVLDPPGANANGTAADATCDRARLSDFLPEVCERFYPHGATVTVTARPVAGGEFLGWSDWACAASAPCRLTLDAQETSLVGRFSPTKVGLRIRGTGSGRIASETPGLACTVDDGDCVAAPFPVGRPLTLVADRAFSLVAWKFGCTPAPDVRRCTLTPTNDPHWVGVAVGRDSTFEPPARLSVRFGVAREGQGTVAGRQIECGSRCERRYTFGDAEELVARPAAGWRFTEWRGGCEREQPCRIVIGPVTSVQAVFARNLAPRLLGVRTAGRGASRSVVVRVSVATPARARVVVRPTGRRAVADRTFPLRAGASTLSVRLPRAAPAGIYRVTVAVSDGQGGGRTFTVQRRVAR